MISKVGKLRSILGGQRKSAGKSLFDRIRRTTFAAFGVSAAVGFGLIAVFLQSGWPSFPAVPVSGPPAGRQVVHDALALTHPATHSPAPGPEAGVGLRSGPGGPTAVAAEPNATAVSGSRRLASPPKPASVAPPSAEQQPVPAPSSPAAPVAAGGGNAPAPQDGGAGAGAPAPVPARAPAPAGGGHSGGKGNHNGRGHSKNPGEPPEESPAPEPAPAAGPSEGKGEGHHSKSPSPPVKGGPSGQAEVPLPPVPTAESQDSGRDHGSGNDHGGGKGSEGKHGGE